MPKYHDILAEVASERARQIEQEGFTAEHDDRHRGGQLAEAAACYAGAMTENAPLPRHWPWEARWWAPKDRRRNLIRALALLVAEVERLDRLEWNTGVKRVVDWLYDQNNILSRDEWKGIAEKMLAGEAPCFSPKRHGVSQPSAVREAIGDLVDEIGVLPAPPVHVPPKDAKASEADRKTLPEKEREKVPGWWKIEATIYTVPVPKGKPPAHRVKVASPPELSHAHVDFLRVLGAYYDNLGEVAPGEKIDIPLHEWRVLRHKLIAAGFTAPAIPGNYSDEE
jgi:hypothetical protein